ncbi:hypothetical protein CHUUTOTORO_02840 [Serratia phage vB_SmaM-ChuuTotoro]|nr:hypothetical protein CHUUTOTORO_02840 [Serratia phage vB_SmaM-ChuuTotoro]
MKDSKVLSWILFAFWVPVALFICVLRVIVRLVAKAAFRLNKGAWWLDGKTRHLGESVGRWFYNAKCFEWLREKHNTARKKAFDDWMAND